MDAITSGFNSALTTATKAWNKLSFPQQITASIFGAGAAVLWPVSYGYARHSINKNSEFVAEQLAEKFVKAGNPDTSDPAAVAQWLRELPPAPAFASFRKEVEKTVAPWAAAAGKAEGELKAALQKVVDAEKKAAAEAKKEAAKAKEGEEAKDAEKAAEGEEAKAEEPKETAAEVLLQRVGKEAITTVLADAKTEIVDNEEIAKIEVKVDEKADKAKAAEALANAFADKVSEGEGEKAKEVPTAFAKAKEANAKAVKESPDQKYMDKVSKYEENIEKAGFVEKVKIGATSSPYAVSNWVAAATLIAGISTVALQFVGPKPTVPVARPAVAVKA